VDARTRDGLAGRPQSFFVRHGISRTVVVRLVIAVSMLMVVGIRFERTIVALTISAVFLAVFFLLGRRHDGARPT
jgi:hypothetical protein